MESASDIKAYYFLTWRLELAVKSLSEVTFPFLLSTWVRRQVNCDIRCSSIYVEIVRIARTWSSKMKFYDSLKVINVNYK